MENPTYFNSTETNEVVLSVLNTMCPEDCNEQGKCVNGTCQCIPGMNYIFMHLEFCFFVHLSAILRLKLVSHWQDKLSGHC